MSNESGKPLGPVWVYSFLVEAYACIPMSRDFLMMFCGLNRSVQYPFREDEFAQFRENLHDDGFLLTKITRFPLGGLEDVPCITIKKEGIVEYLPKKPPTATAF